MPSTKMVPLDQIHPPRTDRARRKGGPLILTQQGWYEVLTGHAAYQAAVAAEQEVVLCLERFDVPGDPLDRLAEHLYLNGLGLDPLDEARSMQELLEQWGVTQRELARRIGVTQSHVSKRLSLLDLSPADQARLGDGLLTIEQAWRKARGLRSRNARSRTPSHAGQRCSN